MSSVPLVFRACVYCGAPGAAVCEAHLDLPALDTQRHPSLYVNTTGTAALSMPGGAAVPLEAN